MAKGGVLTRLIRQSGFYALGNFAVKGAGLLLAPFLLNPAYLSVADYGYFALLSVTGQLGIFMVGLGLGMGLLRFLSDETPGPDREALPFTALLTTAGLAGTALVVLVAMASPLAAWVLDDGTKVNLFYLLAAYLALKVVGGIPMVLLRVQERAGLYAFAVAAEMMVLVGGVYVELVQQGHGLEGLMRAYTWSAGASAAVLVIGMLMRVPWRFRRTLVMPLMRYGAPLVMAGLAAWFLNVGDRYLLKWLAAPETVGIYDWAARLAGVINMFFVQSFQLAFTVIGLKSISSGDRGVQRRTFRHYTIWTGWAVLGLSLLTFDLMTVLVTRFGVDASYLESDALVLPLSLGFLAYGVYVIANNVLYATGHTGTIGSNVLLAAVLNAVLNVVLIPKFGGMGAALATVLAYVALALVSMWVAERKMHVGYPWRVVGVILVMILVLYAVAWPTTAWPVGPRLLARVACILLYVPLLLVFRLYTVEEIRTGWAAFQRWRQRAPDA